MSAGRPPRPWRRWLIDLVLTAGGIVSLIFGPFSIALHSVIGLIFVGTVGRTCGAAAPGSAGDAGPPAAARAAVGAADAAGTVS